MKKEKTIKENNQYDLFDKIFLKAVSGLVVGKKINVQFQGTRRELQVVSEAIQATRNFQDELNRPGASLDSILYRLGAKHIAAVEFEKTLGISWPL